MTIQETNLIQDAAGWIRERSIGAEGSHDYFHVARVAALAQSLAVKEPAADEMVVMLAAWMHDVADAKFHDGDEEIGPRIARDWLETKRVRDSNWLEPRRIDAIVFIVANLSFRHLLERRDTVQQAAFGNLEDKFENQLEALGINLEFGIVHDADKLDAIGAIGIARCFAYGGFKGRPLYDPAHPPQNISGKEEYTKSQGPSLNHFYEKLFKLKDLMRTEAGRSFAAQRHRYMQNFVDRFLDEWEGRV